MELSRETKTIPAKGDPLKNKSTFSSAITTDSEVITLNGIAAGGTAPYKFAYYYKKATDSKWTRLSYDGTTAYVEGTSFTFKPETEGTYTVRVNVKDSDTTMVQKNFTVSVTDAQA